jgi:predicted aldo/keto reductase-like oxidoreductase
MESIRLGKTELMVSALGFGGIPIVRLNFDDAVEVVRHCHDRGITFFDTANVYGDSEKKIGAALESVRPDIVLATKTLMRDADNAAEHVAYSLENLQTDFIDIYQVHNIANKETLDTVLAAGGAYEALAKAREDGNIRFIGFSSHNIPTAIEGCRTGKFDTLQFPFNFIESDPADELFKVADDIDMGIIAMKPLGGGLLERADLCFKFLQQHPHVIPIPGIQYKEEVDEIAALYDSPVPLTDADRTAMDEIRADLGTSFCHRCEYCQPCKNDVKVPGVLNFRSVIKRLMPAAAITMASAAMESAENCDECGECIEKCPYDLPIPDLLKENLSLYRDFLKEHS